MNENNFDRENITDKNISAHMQEKQSGNEDDENNNFEKNMSVSNKSADENARKINNKT